MGQRVSGMLSTYVYVSDFAQLIAVTGVTGSKNDLMRQLT